jgi:hypothetical protein
MCILDCINFQAEAIKPPDDMPDVVNDFDIEEEEIAVENRWVGRLS